MAILLAAAAGGLVHCISTLWGLQEQRFAAIFDAVSSAARSFTMALMLCFVTVYQRLSEVGAFL